MAWTKGKSGNPSGRPKGFKGLAKEVRKGTDDGAELVEFALKIMRGEAPEGSHKTPSLEMRFDAVKWLADRGYGKAMQVVQLEIDDGRFPELDFSKLSPEQLETFERLLDTASGEPLALPGKVLDVES